MAALILAPVGAGWSWGSPATELRWYSTGLGSAATRLQLAGNLGLLVVPAGLAVLLWPPLRRVHLLAGAALAAGATIELLQWALPLGRVVSPLDAVLNAAGAVVGGLVVARISAVLDRHRRRKPAVVEPAVVEQQQPGLPGQRHRRPGTLPLAVGGDSRRRPGEETVCPPS